MCLYFGVPSLEKDSRNNFNYIQSCWIKWSLNSHAGWGFVLNLLGSGPVFVCIFELPYIAVFLATFTRDLSFSIIQPIQSSQVYISDLPVAAITHICVLTMNRDRVLLSSLLLHTQRLGETVTPFLSNPRFSCFDFLCPSQLLCSFPPSLLTSFLLPPSKWWDQKVQVRNNE